MKRVGPACAAVEAAALALTGCSSAGSSASGVGPNGQITLQMWDAQSTTDHTVMVQLAAQYHKLHPKVTINVLTGGSTDGDLLPKVTAALAAGSAPDIAYIYGSYAANIAASGKTVNLASQIHQPGFNWSDYYPASIQTVSPGGKVIGFPALIDNLSVIYNKKLFAAAGVAPPSPGWTWDQFRATAKRLTDSSKHIFGVNYPTGGDSLDTSWRLFPGLWQRGGQILSAGNKKALFNSPAGVADLTVWQQMATVDHSVFLDPTANNAEALFTSGHLAMFVSGPWEVPVLNQAHLDWGDVQLPGVNGNHQTVSGPDNWVLFNNGSARVDASVAYMKWLEDPAQELKWDLVSGSLPIRPSMLTTAGYHQFLTQYPGIGPMAENLANAKEAMPALAQWPRIVDSLGTSIASVLLGKSQPKAALDQAAQEADTLLNAPASG